MLNYDLSMQINYIKSVGATIGRPRVFGKNIWQNSIKLYSFLRTTDVYSVVR